ncbi:MAG: IPT/TIG domain-containing protein [Proteobacteria bacterium]|nr:IPT/TIG domain-containing protein [Cystobacterineae bacterium]MCL2315323.1 IPT/TIG domain-containing protein [Pseudomonadota bacterium]
MKAWKLWHWAVLLVLVAACGGGVLEDNLHKNRETIKLKPGCVVCGAVCCEATYVCGENNTCQPVELPGEFPVELPGEFPVELPGEFPGRPIVRHAPTIAGFEPTSAQHGTLLTISGSNFSTVPSENLVRLGSVEVSADSSSETHITLWVPQNKSCSGPVRVTVHGVTTSSSTNFTYVPTATVSTLGSSVAAGLGAPQGLAIDVSPGNNMPLDNNVSSGNLYVADTGRHCIFRVDLSSSSIATFAGSCGAPGFVNNEGIHAQFRYPRGMVVNTSSNNLYVTDSGNNCIRNIDLSTSSVTTFAGRCSTETLGSTDGVLMAAQFRSPQGITIDMSSGNLYVADTGSHRIRMATPTGVVSTFADSNLGSANGSGAAARFHSPNGIVRDTEGNFYVADTGNNCIRRVAPNAEVSAFVGNCGVTQETSFVDGVGAAAQFQSPHGIVMGTEGNLYVADTGNHCIRRIDSSTLSVTTFAGSCGTPGLSNGPGTVARFQSPYDIVRDAEGNFYVADSGNRRIRKINLE